MDVEKDARKLLQRMIRYSGFIADGIYHEHPRFWSSDNRCSSSLIDLGMFGYLQRQRLIQRDRCGRYLVTEKGRRFARPWYIRWFELA